MTPGSHDIFLYDLLSNVGIKLSISLRNVELFPFVCVYTCACTHVCTYVPQYACDDEESSWSQFFLSTFTRVPGIVLGLSGFCPLSHLSRPDAFVLM